MTEFEDYHDHGTYQIRIMGNLDTGWSSWFHGMQVSSLEGGRITTLTGKLADQASLRGILNKLWNLNLIVISVHRTGN